MREITRQILIRFGLETAYDINCGWCEEWALAAQREFGGEVMWLDEVSEYYQRYYAANCRSDGGWDPPHAHAVLYLNERYYDSQHPDGVTSVFDLDLVRGVTRAEFLKQN